MDAVTFHESDDRLELYALSRLPDSDVAKIEEHLLICDLCRDRLDETGAFAEAMRTAFKSQPAREVSAVHRGWFGWLRPQFALAGAFAAVVLAVGIYWTAGAARMMPVASLQFNIANRGSEVKTVKTAKELDLSFGEAAGVARIDVVDSSGETVWTGAPEPGRPVEAKVREALSPGGYFARTYTASGQMLHEYGFRVEK
ncbi:MAG TPA: hypothetical protein VFC21_00985 [Bryobacteraceae bacterium]|nr:hypothetical protein [Bryobacteraceae bacterium]